MKNRSQHRREARAGIYRTDCLQPIASSDQIGARARGEHGYTSASLTRPRRGSDRSPLGSWGSLLESSGDASVRATRLHETNGRAAAKVGEPLYMPAWLDWSARAGCGCPASLGSRLPPCHGTAWQQRWRAPGRPGQQLALSDLARAGSMETQHRSGRKMK